ncbi:MAG: response regulator transcription factor [Clostridia bacterium]|nr:response regulator transcription factor [Clostridia bacterium]
MFNVLIAEDENNIRKLISIKLKNAGYNVLLACDGLEALNIVYETHVDIIIADVMMPNMSGYELVKTLRDDGKKIPVILCTAKGGIHDKAEGFSLGVDDYMVKPIDFDELLMRIKAVLRRSQTVSEQKLIIGSVVLDYNTLTVSNGTVTESFTKKEFNILYKLLSYPEKSFSKSQLFEEFWSFDSDTEEDAVKVYVNKIRNKIEPFSEIDVQTVRGVGYRGVRNEQK